ncbi:MULTISPECIES: DUF5367 domain-containing protein [unclassified Sphingobacterium]|uniref:DUF5367 domain-containing protein n=1 Tax=unclassified Sphingobacterium TaxID=2609468 RepID=UPI0025EAE7B5|nr:MULTISPECIES: DUF5367 domain-containing protein [unclassified Sphingobacterium]
MKKTFVLPILAVGFLIWFLATLAFRLAGQFFFITDSSAILTSLYIVVIPALILISALTFKRFKLSGLENIVAGVLLVLPGMVLDTFVIHFFEQIYPNMPSSRAATFGSWLMWAYSVVLLTSIFIGLRQNINLNRD